MSAVSCVENFETGGFMSQHVLRKDDDNDASWISVPVVLVPF